LLEYFKLSHLFIEQGMGIQEEDAVMELKCVEMLRCFC